MLNPEQKKALGKVWKQTKKIAGEVKDGTVEGFNLFKDDVKRTFDPPQGAVNDNAPEEIQPPQRQKPRLKNKKFDI